MYIGKNRPMRAEKDATEIYAAFGTIFRISKCFKSKRKLHIIFPLELGKLKI
jgi:hypothetical protein